MKKNLLLTLLLIASLSLFSQSITKIDYFNWSNPNTFNTSPGPSIKGYGFYSDSLSQANDGKIFYEFNNEYYCIESWADYYYWFTKAYKNMFEEPQLYEYYYWVNDDYGMASYIASNKYLGKYYPSSIQVNLKGLTTEDNRLNSNKYIPENENKINELNNQILTKKVEKNNPDIDKKNTNPYVFKKEQFRKTKLDNSVQKTETPKATKSPSTNQSTKKETHK
ncbi:MAG: hypothetical protein A2041_05495 [Bacteroidetes bacterium GWA2_31_9b]|nr:MAG: hypothetical protein A2041_05495 [Bacteroidetes bacterium GWA2_31_9b]